MPNKTIDGPNIFDRLFDRLPNPPEDYFRKFVLDGSSLKKSGDSYLLRMQENFEVSCTHDYRNKLNEVQLEEILIFLKVSNKAGAKGLQPTEALRQPGD